MTEPIQAYPLQWPPGWPRAKFRKSASFNKKSTSASSRIAQLSPADGALRVLYELERLKVERHDVVISTNLKLRIDGLPRDEYAGGEPGAAVYWRKGKQTRCMAIDVYHRVADNLAAIAATLEAMRAIERHGGAEILDRAFTGFTALPAPEQSWQVLGLDTSRPTRQQIDEAHRRLASKHHPDKGGSSDEMGRINAARDELYRSLGL